MATKKGTLSKPIAKKTTTKKVVAKKTPNKAAPKKTAKPVEKKEAAKKQEESIYATNVSVVFAMAVEALILLLGYLIIMNA